MKMKLPPNVVVLATLSLALCLWGGNASYISAGEVRTWTDATGKFTIEAKLLSVREETIRLEKKDGSVIEVPISKLSDVDLELVASQQNSATKPEQNTHEVANRKPSSEYPRLSVTEWNEEATADLESYKKKWAGKIVEIEGLIRGFDWGEQFGQGSSLVFVGEGSDDIGMVCKAPDSSFRPWTRYQSGKQGIVRGKVTIGRFDKPFLDAAEFVWSESDGTPQISVNEIITAFVSDAESAKAKFGDQLFVISGKLLRRTGKPGDGRRAILQGKDGINFELHHMASEDFEDIEISGDVHVIGKCQFGGIWLNHEKVGASMCERLPVPEKKAE